jgi:hypothetical protein
LNYEEIPLAPEAACVGLEIRVVGNDSGEKVIGCTFVIYFYLFGVLLHLQWKNGLGFLLFFCLISIFWLTQFEFREF